MAGKQSWLEHYQKCMVYTRRQIAEVIDQQLGWFEERDRKDVVWNLYRYYRKIISINAKANSTSDAFQRLFM